METIIYSGLRSFLRRTLSAWAIGALLLANAAEAGDFDFTYYFTLGSYVTISGYTGTASVVVIPATLKLGGIDYPVTGIGNNAFRNNYTVRSVTTPASVTAIGDYAFYNCTVTNVTITSTTGSISLGDYVFGNCGGLRSIVIPDCVGSMGARAFWNDYTLTNCVIGSGVSYFSGGHPFDGCAALVNISVSSGNSNFSSTNGVLFNKSQTDLLTYPPAKTDPSYVIPSTVTYVRDSAFNSCPALARVFVPTNVIYLGDNAFSYCSNPLRSIYFQGTPPGHGPTPFTGDTSLTVYHAPGIEGWGATFCGRPTLVQYPDFDYATNSDSTATITGYYGTNQTITVPQTVYALPVKTIASSAFQGLSTVTNAVIPNGVVTLGDYAFQNCSNLRSVSIGTNVMSIGAVSFYGCTALTTVTIPPSVTSIGGSAFSGCANLTKIYFQGNAPTASWNSFSGVPAWAYYLPAKTGWNLSPPVYHGLTLMAWYPQFTYQVTGGAVVITGYTGAGGAETIPASMDGLPVTTIGAGAFANCTALTSLSIPDSVIAIGNSAFTGCTGLTSLTLPGSVAAIGDSAFANCTQLEAVYALGSATLGSGAFDGDTLARFYCVPGVTGWGAYSPQWWSGDCYYATNADESVTLTKYVGAGGTMTIPDSVNGLRVTAVGAGAFSNCAALVSVTLGTNVVAVGDRAFAGCAQLTGLFFLGNAPSLGTEVFAQDEALTLYAEVSTSGWDGLPHRNWHAQFLCEVADGAITITGYIGSGGAEVIPSAINLMPVTAIGASAFSGRGDVSGIVIPTSVTNIGPSAFEGTGLLKVTIPEGVTGIGVGAFTNCAYLASAVLGTNVTHLSGGDIFGLDWHPTSLFFRGEAPPEGWCDFLPSPNDVVAYYVPGAAGWASFTALQKLVWYPQFAYSVINGALTITGYLGAGGEETIPDSINGTPVTAIGAEAFLNCQGLSRILIGANVTNLGARAFSGCTGLTSVTIPASVTALGDEVFSGCTGLTDVTCLDNVTSLGWGIFNGESPTLFCELGTSGWDSFSVQWWFQDYFCSINDGGLSVTLTKYIGPGGAVTVPETLNGLTVTGLGATVFANNGLVTGLTIPASVTDIGDGAFAYCSNLTAFAVAPLNPSFCSPDGALLTADQTTLLQYPLGRGDADYAVSNAVQTIGNHAFAGCTNLVTVTIPASVTAIGDGAFAACPKLAGLYFLGTPPPSLSGDDPFAGDADTGAKVYGEPGLGWANNGWYGSLMTYPWFPGYECSFNSWDDFVTLTRYIGPGGDVTIPDRINNLDIRVIADGAFSNCTALTSVAISAKVTAIGNLAFFDCPNLGTLTVSPSSTAYSSTPDGVLFDLAQTTLLQYPAGKADSSFTVSNGVASIGAYAFAGSTHLVSVTIPASVTWIADGAFAGCTNLRALYFCGDEHGLGADVFAGVNAVVYYPPGAGWWDVSYGGLPAYAWSAGFFCSVNGWDGGITITGYNGPGGDVTIPDLIEGRTVTAIGAAAFSNCTALASVALPDGVTDIGETAFCGCSNLTGVAIGSGLATIGYHAFFACPRLSAFTVSPANTTYSSPDGVLYDLNQTMLVLYPAGKSDTAYTISSGALSISADAFAGSTNLVSVRVPASVYSIADGAFAGCTSLRSLFFDGDAPWQLGSDVFAGVDATIYYPPGAGSWDVSYGGLPAYAWSSGFLCSINWGDGGSIIIIGYDGPGGAVAIPDSINGRNVTGIADGAFSNCTALTSLAIPGSVTSIGSRAVVECRNLTAVSVDAANTTYSSSPDGVLFNVDQTALLLFPAGRSDSSYTIPDGVTAIGAFAFSGNTNLVSAAVPASVTSIGSCPFYDCPNLTGISVDPANPSCCSVDGVLFGGYWWSNHDVLVQYPSGKSGSSYQIPDGTIFLGAYAFSGCTNLTKVASFDSLIGVWDHAFYDCPNLESFIFGQLGWFWGDFGIGDQAFAACPRLAAIYFDNRAPVLGLDVFAGETAPVFYCVPGTTGWDGLPHQLWRYPFYCATNDDGTVAITGYLGTGGAEAIPDSINGIPVTRIADAAFSNCVGLTSLSIPAAVTNIGTGVFYGCTGLTSFWVHWDNPTFSSGGGGVLFDKAGSTLIQYPAGRPDTSYGTPDSVTTVTDQAFAGATNLFHVWISGSVAVIATDAFAGCVNLQDFGIDGGNATFSSSDGVLFDKAGATLLRYPDGRPDSAYTLPDGVSAVGIEAFAGCTDLTSVTVSGGVSFLADGAFAGCTGLTDIYFLGAAPTLGTDVFAGVDARIHYLQGNPGWGAALFGGLQTLVWYPQFAWTLNGDGTVTITGYNGSGGVASIPDAIEGHAVIGIGNSAFANCGSLTDLLVPASVTNVADSAFSSCWNLHRVVFEGAAPVFGTGVFDGDNLSVCYPYAFALSGWDALPGGFPPTAFWSAPYAYSVDSGSGDATILRYLGAGGSETIPAALDGAPVVCLGGDAFNGCTALTNAVIPVGVVTIGNGAFNNCTGLLHATIPAGVMTIGDWAFGNCTRLAGIVIPEGVTSIGNWAFSCCASLPEVSLPSSVYWIGYQALYPCTNLSAIAVDPSNAWYTNVVGALFDHTMTTLFQYPPASPATAFVIPDGTLTIFSTAFAQCGNLTAVTIPDSVIAIGTQAFTGSGLARVTIPGSVGGIEWATFQGCTNLVTVTLLPGLTRIESQAFGGCSALTNATLPVGVTTVGGGAFSGCTRLSEITLPDSVTAIGSQAFTGSGLASVTVPGSVGGIESATFQGCTNLATVTILPGPTQIGSQAFSGCTVLTSVTLPVGVITVGGDAFSGCTSLSEITLPGTVRNLYGSVFAGCSNLRHVALPGGLTSIPDAAFYECGSLRSIDIPDTVTSIGSWAFDMSGLTNVVVSDHVTSVGAWAFANCHSLTHATLSTNCTTIATGLFYGCALTALTIPNTVTRIEDSAFLGCSGLTGIVIPANVTAIGRTAFYGCTGLTTLTIPARMATLGDYAFASCSGLTGIYFEGNAPDISDHTFAGAWWGTFDTATVYYRSTADGWGSPLFGGLQTAVWNQAPLRIIADAAFGVQAGHFGFRITGDTNQVVVVEACTNLANPVWVPLGTKTLTGGTSTFDDSDQSSHPARFYRVHTQ